MTLAIVNNDVVAFRIGDTNSRNWLQAQKNERNCELNYYFFFIADVTFYWTFIH